MLRQPQTQPLIKRDSTSHIHKMVKLCEVTDMLHISSIMVITTQAYSYNMLNTLNTSVFIG